MADSLTYTHAAEVERILARYRTPIVSGIRRAVERAWAQLAPASEIAALTAEFEGQIEYHLGWRHPDLSRARSHPGKLLRPTLLLLACELAAGTNGADAAERARLAQRAVSAAVCVELVHNFSLIHDDIEDGDDERRHRPTLWKLWGVPQAINAGDALFALARTGLWELVDAGVPPRAVVALAALLDRTCLALCEGQFLDMRFERHRDVTVAMYVAMIERKTAALMACAAESGGWLGARDTASESGASGGASVAQALARFGRALGVAFQLRDDLLGIWSAVDLGKTPGGDLRRKKMTLPVLHAFETAAPADRALLEAIYSESQAASEAQIASALTILDRTGARARVRDALWQAAQSARAALDEAAGAAPEAREAHAQLATLLDFVTAVDA